MLLQMNTLRKCEYLLAFSENLWNAHLIPLQGFDTKQKIIDMGQRNEIRGQREGEIGEKEARSCCLMKQYLILFANSVQCIHCCPLYSTYQASWGSCRLPTMHVYRVMQAMHILLPKSFYNIHFYFKNRLILYSHKTWLYVSLCR